MRTFGALRATDIDGLLGGEHRAEALNYLAACSRLMAALEPFAQLTHGGPLDYVARHVAAALAACQCQEDPWPSSPAPSSST
jgi:hypothetical protein